MRSALRRLTSFAVAAFGLSLFASACSVHEASFTGIDANAPPGTAILTVTRNGTSTGTVSSNPGGITCGASCSAAFQLGSLVTLTATPDTGAELAGWSGGGCTSRTPTCTVTVAAATTVTATFDIAEYLVTINLGGSGTGLVVAPSAGITCPGSCTAMVPHGSRLSLAASTGASSLFMGWTVGGGGTACTGTGTCSTTITGPTTITATFALDQTLEVTKSGTGSGTVTSNPTGINCGADCSETYPPATAVTLTATAAGDSIFLGWSGGGCSGTGPCNVVVTGAALVTADFALRKYNFTVNKAGLGAGTVISTPAGIDCGASCTAAYDAGTLVTLTASPTAGSLFAGWSGGGCTGTSTCVVTMASATTVTATFNPILHTLTVVRAGAGAGTVTSAPAGISCGADCTEDYAQGAMVTLTAAPNTGSTFAGWSGGGCTGTGTCTVTMAAAVTVTASFSSIQHTLTVTRNGTGAGSVSSSPAGITCGADCTEAYTFGTGVTLTAAADPGSTFSGWIGGGCTGTGTCMVTMNMATTVTATFTLNTYTLTASTSGTGAGTIASTPAGITCGADCSEVYNHGTVVTLTATPATGSTFGGWGGACTGTGGCVVTMTAAASVSAIFTANQYAVVVAKTGAGTGTVTSSPAGITCGTDCTETVNHGTVMTLTATPAAGSTFGGWSGGGCSGTGTCVVTVTAATTVTADFALAPFTLTVTRSGTGTGTVTSSPAGISCGSDCTESYLNGTTVTLTAATGTGSTFTGWSGGGCSGTGTCTVTITASVNVTATFTLNTYTLSVVTAGTGAGTVTSSPAGISCGADCSEVVGHGTVMTLTATPAAGSTFTGWSGGGCTGTGTCAVTVTAATTVSATFTLNTYPLSVTKAGTGSGTVTSSPAGVNCGATCSATFDHGTAVTLTASPSVGSTFTGWSGGGCAGTGTCNVTMTAATAVTATFTLNTYTLAVALAGTGSGSVTSSPAGITCGADCSEVVGHGTVMTLTASPAVGSTFAGWSGGGCTGTGTCAVTVTAATTVTASFTLNSYTLTAAKSGTGAGTVTSSPAGINCGATCAQSVSHGSMVTLTASPSSGSTFAGWSGGGCAGTGTCVVTVTSATTVTASFTLNTYTLTVTIGASSGSGSVSSSPAGITCGADCSEVYGHGTSVTLTATPNASSTFSGWSGACTGTGTCTVPMTGPTVATATFAIATYPLTVVSAGSGRGSVTSSPAGINCGVTCSATYNHGTTVTLTATPAFGSIFTGWSGGGCAGTGTCSVTVTSATSVTATFTVFCGNGFCDGGETCASCPSDCGPCIFCGDGICNGGENCASCPGDCGGCCGNGLCDNGESCGSCPSDCGGCCGNGLCDNGESCASCPGDCGGCCGNGVCDNGESCASCPGDCGGCCGNGVCDNGESCASCPGDCGGCCGNGVCDNGESCASCPGDCGGCCGNGVCDNGESCASCPGDCGGCCGNGVCDNGESCASCPGDCGSCCGNGLCDNGESCASCPGDCGPCSYCGDGVCDPGEDPFNCPEDCCRTFDCCYLGPEGNRICF